MFAKPIVNPFARLRTYVGIGLQKSSATVKMASRDFFEVPRDVRVVVCRVVEGLGGEARP